MAVSFIAAGAFASGTGALTVGQPTGRAAGDLLLLLVESANQAVATPAGYTAVPASVPFTGTAATAGGVRLQMFYKVSAATEASAAVADSGDHTTARIFAFRGVDRAAPFEAAVSSSAAAATAMSWPGITTTIPNCMVVLAAAMDTDAASTATCTGYANANLTALTERADQTVASGVGGGLVLATGFKAAPGLVGVTSATGSTAVTHAYMTLALRPQDELRAVCGPGSLGWVETSVPNDYYGGMAYGGGMFVATRSVYGTAAASSPDGITWTARGMSVGSYAWGAAVYGNGRFVTVGGAQAAVSLDGITWTYHTTAVDPRYTTAVAFGNGVFTAVSCNGNSVQTSPDGITWTAGTLALAVDINYGALAFGAGKFVLLDYATTGNVQYSTDGLSWTARAMPVAQGWRTVVYGNGRFLAAGPGGQATSLDGIVWTVVPGAPTDMTVLHFANGAFYHFDAGVYRTSTDGVNWSYRGLPQVVKSTSFPPKGVAGSGGLALFRSFGAAFTELSGVPTATGTLTASVAPPPLGPAAALAASVQAVAAATGNIVAPVVLNAVRSASSTATATLSTSPHARDVSPAFVAAGAFQSGIGALTVPQPAGIAQGDLLVLAIESANQPVAAPSGWSQIGATQSMGTAAAANSLALQVYYKLAGASEASVAVPDSGDHTSARILAYRGVDPSAPIESWSQSQNDRADQTTLSAVVDTPALSSSSKSLTIGVFGLDSDIAASPAVTYGSASWWPAADRFYDRGSNTSAAGTGGGLAFCEFNKTRVEGETSIESLRISGNAPAPGFIAFTSFSIKPRGAASLESAWSALASSTATGGFTPARAAYGADRWAGYTGMNTVRVWHDLSPDYSSAEYPMPAAQTAGGMAFGAGTFVFIDSTGGTATSPDGLTWTAGPTPMPSVTALVRVGDLFIASNYSNTIVTSSDGLTWSAAITLPGSAPTFTFTGTKYVGIATGASGTSTAAFESLDGAVWTALPVAEISGTYEMVGYAAGVLCMDSPSGVSRLSVDGGLSWFRSIADRINIHNGRFFGYSRSITGISQYIESDTGFDWRRSSMGITVPATAPRSGAKVLLGTTRYTLPGPTGAVSSASGTLSSVPAELVAGIAVGTSTAASLSAQVRLNAACSALATAGASLLAQISARATALVTSAAIATLTAGIRLASSAAAVSTAAALLIIPAEPPMLDAAPVAAASASATLTTAVRLAGTANAASAAGAGVATQIRLNAPVAAGSMATGALGTAVRLAASPQAQAQSASGLITSVLLQGTAAAQSQAWSALTVGALLRCTAAAQSQAFAAMTAGPLLQGAAGAQSQTASDLTTGFLLQSAAAAQAVTVLADLTTDVLLQGAAFAQAQAAPDLTTAVLLQASASAIATATGLIAVPPAVALVGHLAAQSLAASAINTSIRLQASASVQSTLSGALGIAKPVAAQAACVSQASGALTTGLRLATMGAVQSSTMAALQEFTRLTASAQATSTAVGTLWAVVPDIRRTFIVLAELRALVIPAEPRTVAAWPALVIVVLAESRVMAVNAEHRTTLIAAARRLVRAT